MAAADGGGGPPVGEEKGEEHQRVVAAEAEGERGRRGVETREQRVDSGAERHGARVLHVGGSRLGFYTRRAGAAPLPPAA